MRRNKDLFLASCLVLILVTIVLMVTGCSSPKSTAQNGGLATNSGALPQSGLEPPPPPNLSKVAEVLGIDEQELSDAFAQARTELGIKGMPPNDRTVTPPGQSDSANLPELPLPPEQNDGSLGPRMPSNDQLLSRVAEILGIDEQKLRDAFARAQE